MALTLEQTYTLARACQKAENAAEAITLTNNPATGLQDTLTAAIAALIAAVQAVVISDGQSVTIQTVGGANTGSATASVVGGTLVGVKLPTTAAIVPDTGGIIVRQANGTTVNGVAGVVNSGVSQVNLPATTSMVSNANTLPVQNSAGTAIDAAAVATVAGGVVTAVKLATTKAGITSGTKITATVTGSGTTGVTPTIVNGVVTALVLS